MVGNFGKIIIVPCFWLISRALQWQGVCVCGGGGGVGFRPLLFFPTRTSINVPAIILGAAVATCKGPGITHLAQACGLKENGDCLTEYLYQRAEFNPAAAVPGERSLKIGQGDRQLNIGNRRAFGDDSDWRYRSCRGYPKNMAIGWKARMGIGNDSI